MKEYKVVIQKSAESDLNEIVEYIAVDLSEKEIAFKLYKKIKDNITSLSLSPGRCAVIDEEQFKSMEIRRLLIDNYSVFYYIDKETLSVHILRILYNRRDWKKLVIKQ